MEPLPFFLTHYGVSLRSPSCVMCESLSKEIWQGLCKEKEIKLRWGKHINLVKLNADPHLLSPCSSALLLFPFPTQIMCSAHSEKSANFRPRFSLAYTGSYGGAELCATPPLAAPPPLSLPLSLFLCLSPTHTYRKLLTHIYFQLFFLSPCVTLRCLMDAGLWCKWVLSFRLTGMEHIDCVTNRKRRSGVEDKHTITQITRKKQRERNASIECMELMDNVSPLWCWQAGRVVL